MRGGVSNPYWIRLTCIVPPEKRVWHMPGPLPRALDNVSDLS
jgi:hypothetical protein